MNNGARFRATALLGAVLAAGVALGWVAHDRYERSRGGRGRGTEALIERMTKDLGLTGAQRDSVRVVLERRHADFDSLRAGVRPRFEAIRARTYAEVERVLTPAQQRKYREQVEEKERKRAERRAERRR